MSSDAAARRDLDRNAVIPRARDQSRELIEEIFAKRQTRIEGAIVDLVGIDPEPDEARTRLRSSQSISVSSSGGISMLAMFESIAGSFQPGRYGVPRPAVAALRRS